MPFIEPYLVPRDLIRLANVVRRPPFAHRLRVGPTRAPRQAPTWAPRDGAGSVAWDDILAMRIPRAPRLPMDLLAARLPAPESRSATGGARASVAPHDAAEAFAEVTDVLDDLLQTLRLRRPARDAAQPAA